MQQFSICVAITPSGPERKKGVMLGIVPKHEGEMSNKCQKFNIPCSKTGNQKLIICGCSLSLLKP